MRIDFNRICKLAGINDNSRSRSYLNEGVDHENEAMHYHEGDDLYSEGESEEGPSEMMHYHEGEEEDAATAHEMMHYHEGEEEGKEKEKEDQDEMVEVNISELMSEIRRAKKLIKLNEQRARNERARKQRLQESKLKRVIAREVESVLAEMQEYDNYDSEWVYGKRRPRRSRKGYSAQGSYMPGIGFRRY